MGRHVQKHTYSVLYPSWAQLARTKRIPHWHWTLLETLPIPAQDPICSSEHSTHHMGGPPLSGMPTGPGQCYQLYVSGKRPQVCTCTPQWISMGGDSAPRGHLARSETFLSVMTRGGGEVGGYNGGHQVHRVQMPLTAWNAQNRHPEWSYPAQNTKSAEAEKPHSKQVKQDGNSPFDSLKLFWDKCYWQFPNKEPEMGVHDSLNTRCILANKNLLHILLSICLNTRRTTYLTEAESGGWVSSQKGASCLTDACDEQKLWRTDVQWTEAGFLSSGLNTPWTRWHCAFAYQNLSLQTVPTSLHTTLIPAELLPMFPRAPNTHEPQEGEGSRLCQSEPQHKHWPQGAQWLTGKTERLQS